MEEFEISAEARSGLGKGETRRLRRQGLVPAVIYGGGKPYDSCAACKYLASSA